MFREPLQLIEFDDVASAMRRYKADSAPQNLQRLAINLRRAGKGRQLGKIIYREMHGMAKETESFIELINKSQKKKNGQPKARALYTNKLLQDVIRLRDAFLYTDDIEFTDADPHEIRYLVDQANSLAKKVLVHLKDRGTTVLNADRTVMTKRVKDMMVRLNGYLSL